jgi:hypothetical protein
MKTLRTSLLLLAFGLFGLSAPAFASASAYEYYSLSSGPSVCAVQITSIVGTTVYSADGFITTNWNWYIANGPQVGGYIVASCGTSFSALSYSDYSYADENSFEGDYGLETYAHGGHEPIIIILD